MANEDQEKIMMDLEVRLKEDADGSLKSSVAAGIDEQRAAVEAKLRGGAPPDEYRRLEKLKAGLDSASLILDRTWSHYHR